jgi:hypothetical protein
MCRVWEEQTAHWTIMSNIVYGNGMSPKQRFQIMLEPAQLEALKLVEERIGVRVSEQIRRSVDAWLHVDPIASKVLEELPHHKASQKSKIRKVTGGTKRE